MRDSARFRYCARLGNKSPCISTRFLRVIPLIQRNSYPEITVFSLDVTEFFPRYNGTQANQKTTPWPF
jgi:hypothetical protein